jgi:hypothetical protein
MASTEELQQLVGMAIFDRRFREYLLSDPEQAARSVGITLDREQIDAIKRLDPESMGALSVLFSKQIAAAMRKGETEGFWLA